MKTVGYFLGVMSLAFIVGCNRSQDQQEKNVQVEPTINYESVSVAIMQEAKKTLGGELKAALERGGVEEAVTYCNVHALPLTSNVGEKYNATLNRVTDKPRNSANKANSAELAQLDQWRKIIASGDQQVVTTEETESARHFYMPIKIDALCLNCHGVPGETLTPENQALIKAKYPDDMATGYQLGDLRGLWHISFKK